MTTDTPTDPMPYTAYPFDRTTKHPNPVIAALWKAHHAIPEADTTARAAVAGVIAQHELERPFPADYRGRDRDYLVGIADGMGDEDGYDLAPPRFSASDNGDEANAYRAAYRNSVDDRVSEILA